MTDNPLLKRSQTILIDGAWRDGNPSPKGRAYVFPVKEDGGLPLSTPLVCPHPSETWLQTNEHPCGGRSHILSLPFDWIIFVLHNSDDCIWFGDLDPELR